MQKQQEKNPQATSDPSALPSGKSLTRGEFQKQGSAFGDKAFYQGNK